MKSRLDHHPHQLLHQELAGVWDPHLTDILTWLARSAKVLLLLDIGLAEQTALRAHMHSVAVAHIEKSLFQEATWAVTDHTITLHLTETKTTISRSAFSRLSSQDLWWATWPRVDFVAYHMLQTLVISRSQENHNFKFLTSEAVVHDFVTVALVT